MDNFGSNAELFNMDVGGGFLYSERADFSGHKDGRTDPHVNGEVLDQSGNAMGRPYNDLTNNQFNGMNGMQNP